MRVLIVNTSERVGGPAIAAGRLTDALNRHGVRAKMLVRDKLSNKLTVCSVGGSLTLPLKFVWERFCILMSNRLHRENLWQVDIANTGCDITRMYEFAKADIIHLHWTNHGFVSLDVFQRIIESGKPVVVTMHDMWYFTGICHYSAGCNKFEQGCTKCPMLHNGGWGRDIAQRVYKRKQEIYAKGSLSFVGCSKWITDLASGSLLVKGHRVMNIPNAINTDVFRIMDGMNARRRHGLPEDRPLILFSSQRITDERKGFDYLTRACERIMTMDRALSERIGIVVLGDQAETVTRCVPFTVYPVSYLSDEQEIMELYNAVDLFVTPSLQDNLPNTIVEAMACGTPCVGFNVGGIPEMIDHRENGYVAVYKDAEDFARGIIWCLDEKNHERLSRNAHEKAINAYGEANVANRYIELYKQLLKK